MSAAPIDFVRDDFLAADPDCAVYGLNLACAFPFPKTAETAYNALAQGLEALDKGVYVYPFWETHITLVTFVNFSRRRQPDPDAVKEFSGLIEPLSALINDIIDSDSITSFRLGFKPPELWPKAAILPGENSTGEISRIRQAVKNRVDRDPLLKERLAATGLNIPGIIHSTILRFKEPPLDAAGFRAGFQKIAADSAPISFTVNELLLTTETKPYMRGGEIVRRFPLAAAAKPN